MTNLVHNERTKVMVRFASNTGVAAMRQHLCPVFPQLTLPPL